MKYIESISDDIFFNLALEEYAFQNLRDDEYFILWKNDKCIVLGRYQNAFEEINIKEAEKAGVKVARRNSGGGTVFHDKGNLNYSIIKNLEKHSFIDYDSYLMPVISALNSMGIKAEKSKTSDIIIDGKKISGSAQSSRKGRVLHHGTLLFNADLSFLNKILKPTEARVESRSVKSVRSAVTNIVEHIDKNKNISLDDFKNSLLYELFPDGIQKHDFTKKQLEDIIDLKTTKYSDWQWNFGNSPNFTFNKESILNNNSLQIILEVKKGMIFTCTVKCDHIPCREIELAVTGSRYSYIEIMNKLNEVKFINNVSTKINIEELADCFF